MADSINDDTLDNLKNGQSENFAGEIISNKETETVILKQDSENMETHAHHIHKAPGHGWRHYLYEFLMLFLAVFCGFLAENYREHRVEKYKGIEYALSFREDLFKDTSLLNSIIQTLKVNISTGDTLVKMIQTDRFKTQEDIKKLYSLNLTSLRGFGINLTDRTTPQLKNSGGMRLITKTKVVEGILSYWEGSAAIQAVGNALIDMRTKNREISYSIFDNKYYLDSTFKGERVVQNNAKLMTTDYIKLTEFSNRMAHFKNLLKGQFMLTLVNQKHLAESLIKSINEEYGK